MQETRPDPLPTLTPFRLALARYERVDRQGVTHDDAPQIYQRTKPLCDTVRITN